MLSNALPKQIEALVDALRKREEDHVSLREVAAITEVLIKTMQMYFRSVDLNIYQECQSLTDYIANARREIASLQPEDGGGANILRAGKELEAIVAHTEEATNTIMSAAEEIMSANTSDPAAYQAAVQDAVMRIFEACSFQDITGQRISKVVETISYVEQRASELKSLLGIEVLENGPENGPENGVEEREDGRHLLGGPALDGEGIDQNAVDVLMDVAPAAPVPPPAAPAAAAAPQAAETAQPSETPAREVKSAAPVSPAPAAAAEDGENRTTQADIDALFN